MASTASERRPRPASPQPRRRPAPAPLVAVSALVAGLFATPLAYLAIRGVTEGGTLAAWTSAATLGSLARTLLLGVSVAAVSAVLGTALAWLVART
ncbi:MAG TPA: hypothetical protein VG035_07740, partial [Actinomycetota bacterium]|nr:hypothetical protein [Actinomycetota bacterium]